MVSSIDRVSQQAFRAQEVKAAAPKTDVVKTEPKKTEAVAQKPAAPVREAQETKVEEVKEKPAAESAEALRTLAAREPSSPPAGPGKNTVSPEAVIAAYKK
jgi:hypothetical protein